MNKRSILLTIICLTILPLRTAQNKIGSGQSAPKADQSHITISADQIKWMDAPNLGPGIQIAVLEGDPSKDGATYSLRVRMPDGFKVPPHWHPVDENLLVLQGVFVMGMGEKFDQAKGQRLTAGAYARVPKEMRHYGWAKGETVLHLYGVGPFKIIYVNPADDPSKKAGLK